MDGKSLSETELKLNELKQLFPEVFDEGKIDWEKLKATLGEDINLSNERYCLNWAGKTDAFHVLQEPTSKTLVPDKEESVDFENTQNIFIEGENLEVLKVLQKSYFGKVKMIYIDPPYNTGNDSFIYPDKFSQSKRDYLQQVGDVDQEGNRLKEGLFHQNSKENGQYHSNWLNMMMPRLFLARNLLRDDGVIFVSIDDNEVHNLRLLMNELFGEENFVCEYPRVTKKGGKSSAEIAKNHDYVLMYTKNRDNADLSGIRHTDKGYCKKDEYFEDRGFYKVNQTLDYDSLGYVQSLDYPITINGETFYAGGDKEQYENRHKGIHGRADWGWRWSEDLFIFGLENGFIEVHKGGDRPRIYTKTYQNARIVKDNNVYKVEYYDRTKPLSTLEFTDNKYSNDNAKKVLDEIMHKGVFEYTKHTNLICGLSRLVNDDDFIILDFFAGSGTTGHAVYDLNSEDGGKRKFILVQLPEECDEKSEAKKAGYNTIAEVSKERLRRAGKKIKERLEAQDKAQKERLELEDKEDKKSVDLGFKVMKLEESNFKQWQQVDTGEELVEQIELFADPLEEGAKTQNIIYELLLKSGESINSTIEEKSGYYEINSGEIVLVLEGKATEELFSKIIKCRPQKVIALDRVFADNDQLKTNTALQMKDAEITFETI